MRTLNLKANQLKLPAAVLALVIIAALVVAVTLAAGPTQAQDGTPTPTPTPTPSPYADPQPCGPGAATAFQPKPHEVTSGHFALFDAYWRVTERDTAQPTDAGVLHTNQCPPKMVEMTSDGLRTVTVLKRAESNIDIGEAIFHVKDDYKVDVVATNAEATSGQLSLDEYPQLRKALGLGSADPVPAGTQVWWLRLDDPDTDAVDETSKLRLGFSTALFNEEHWVPQMRYKFEVERAPDDYADTRHFYAYEAPNSGNAAQQSPVWNSYEPDRDEQDMTLQPGEYRPLQWIFTEEGTYELSVHLQGFVRDKNPRPLTDEDYDANWRPISDNITETSEVKTYTFQVGSKLEENEPPVFGINLSVPEESPAGTLVGDPIPVFEADAETLYYSLSGDGHADFTVETATNPHAVQIKVADGANLDFETKSSYELTLSVTDRLDHEHNTDTSIDDTLAVRIALEDVSSLSIDVSNSNPQATDEVVFTAVNNDFGKPDEVEYHFTDGNGYALLSPTNGRLTQRLLQHGTLTVHLYATWTPEGERTLRIDAEPVTVTWRP